jgi:hypothetical protein
MSLLPIPVSATLRLLADPGFEPSLSESGWREILGFADRTQTTLFLDRAAALPEWVRAEIAARFAKNDERRRRLKSAYADVAGALSAAGVEFVVLKGFTHEVGFGINGRERVQYDLDLLCTPDSLAPARQALGALGYLPHDQAFSEEHDRPLWKPTPWQWRGDYFDPEIPIAVELHTSVWNPERDRIEIPGLEQFWNRRTMIQVEDRRVPALCEADRVAFAALHVVRHILRNEARPAHVYELARFLSERAPGPAATADHDARIRMLQAIAFRFAAEWFGSGPRAGASLPENLEKWFREFALSPLVNLTRPNKDVLWLHLALLDRPRDRVAVAFDRLAPLRRPRPSESPSRRNAVSRTLYHTAALALALTSGVRWWWRTASSRTAHTSSWKRPGV